MEKTFRSIFTDHPTIKKFDNFDELEKYVTSSPSGSGMLAIFEPDLSKLSSLKDKSKALSLMGSIYVKANPQDDLLFFAHFQRHALEGDILRLPFLRLNEVGITIEENTHAFDVLELKEVIDLQKKTRSIPSIVSR
jgi:hypothetical protein